MIGLILGTSEGKNIISLLNEFTDNILISTATEYGGDLLKEYHYKVINTKPLNGYELRELIISNEVSIFVDASHPYAVEITTNCKNVCKDLNIPYLRYERASVAEKYRHHKKVIFISDYESLPQEIDHIEEVKDGKSVILNTTGSRNIKKILSLGILNRIVHRVLPSVEVMKYCIETGVKVEDIVAIKGPVGYELNKGFIRQYHAKAIILKDSGIQGGTQEKIEAALSEDITILIIERKNEEFENIFNNETSLVEYIKEKNFY